MSSYIIDFDPKKRVGLIKGDNIDVIRDQFSVEDSNAKFLRRTRRVFIPTRKFAITPTGRFEIGLCSSILKVILSLDSNANIQITPAAKKAIKPFSETEFSMLKPDGVELRSYQEQVVNTCISKGRGVVVVATAGGKTLIMSTLISNLIKNCKLNKVIVIVPTQLVKQTYEEFVTYSSGWSCSWWTGDHSPDVNSNVVVVGTKIIQSSKQDVGWMFDADCLFVDEVHGLRHGNVINKIIKKFHTNIRFGFTGTMPEEQLDQWTVTGLIGPIVYEKNSYDLREEKFITPVQAIVAQITYTEKPEFIKSHNATANYQREIDFIINHPKRSDYIKKIVDKINNNMLILVDRIEHGELLYNTLKNHTSKNVFFIRGDVSYQDRDEIKKIMEESYNTICIAISAIFSTGINIKNLHYILFAASGKAKIRIIQSIGRGLRLHASKEKLVIFDIFDDLKYGRAHFEKRKLIYERERIPYKIYNI